jgi:hypothetical protein
MARRGPHNQRRFSVDRPPPTDPPTDEVAAQLLDDWRQARSDASTWRGRVPGSDAADTGEGAEYRVERLEAPRGPALRAAASLQAELTARAAEGWRLCAIVPAPPNDQLAIFERLPEHDAAAPAPAPSRPARPRRSRRRAAAEREWEAAREQFAAERAGDLAPLVTRPSSRYRPPPGTAAVGRRRHAAALAIAILSVALLAIVLLSGDDDPRVVTLPPPARDAAPARPAEPAADAPAPTERDLPRCRDVRPAGGAPVACTTRNRVLIIAGVGRAVQLDGVKHRVRGVSHADGVVTVRLGIRNSSDAALDLMDRPGRSSLVAGGVRLSPAAGVPSTIVAPGRAAETDLRFTTTRAFEAALLRSGGRADLGIGGSAGRTGVLRLVVPPAS